MTYITKDKTPLKAVPNVLRSVGDAAIFFNVPELANAFSNVRVFEEGGETFAQLSGMAPVRDGVTTRMLFYDHGFLTDNAVELLQSCDYLRFRHGSSLQSQAPSAGETNNFHPMNEGAEPSAPNSHDLGTLTSIAHLLARVLSVNVFVAVACAS